MQLHGCQPVIVIDPGHRGPTGGCGYRTWYEGEFVFDVACALQDVARDEPLPGGVSVILSRGVRGPYYYERATALVKSGYDRPYALIHLHVDACPGFTEARGTWAAARSPDNPVACYLCSPEHAPRPDRSMESYVRTLDEPISARALRVVNAFAGCSPWWHCLIELGFITNPDDRDFFLLPDAPAMVAAKLHGGLAAWLATEA